MSVDNIYPTDQLDGLRVNKKKHSSMEDYLQLPDDYDERKCEPGKKRVSIKASFINLYLAINKIGIL